MTTLPEVQRPPRETIIHRSTAEFAQLAAVLVKLTDVPDGDQQVYAQSGKHGLWYRKSGRLITSEQEGTEIVRVRAAAKRDEAGKPHQLIELRRIGPIDGLDRAVMRAGMQRPVHSLVFPGDTRYRQLSWVDEDGLHRVIPNRFTEPETGIRSVPCGVTVSSWETDYLFTHTYQRNPSGHPTMRVRSEAVNDPALPCFEQAVATARAVTGIPYGLMEAMLAEAGE